ncbi:hypothetical protein D9756_001282 [Leucocoprinus leucothites]|uniref:DUF6535 domain-containing protein n=1 Tax=Leucocoprinus leucothites TaxID=201217 RepID=A0A8H5G4D5_9AGAR|nr:hypothetical protein D9756_001282 [Leucoagaricus leucothites]
MPENAGRGDTESFSPFVDEAGHRNSLDELPQIPVEPGLHAAPKRTLAGLSVSPDGKPWQPNTPDVHSVPGRGGHWAHCHQLVQKHDMSSCDLWTEEVDKLLIFAGLFSAAVTAFIIESYRWLQPGPEDRTNQLLEQIYLQLINNNTATSGSSTSLFPISPNREDGSVVRINVCWFLSLTLSLATVLMGILCLQWLREYRREAAIPLPDSISLWHMRHEGLVRWRVPDILSALPLVLQAAFVLFFIGILDLLWSLDHRVAIPVTVAVGLLFIFVLFTTVLPTLQTLFTWSCGLATAQCAYKSPQSWIFFRLTIVCLRFFSLGVSATGRLFSPFFSLFSCQSWNEYDSKWQTARRNATPKQQRSSDDLSAGLLWITRKYNQRAETLHAIHHCLHDVPISTAARVVGALDPQIAERLGPALQPRIKIKPYIGASRVLQPHSELQQDLMMAYFHEKQRRIHPESRIYQLEHIIRFMKSSSHWRIRPYFEWPIEDINTYPEDLVHEFLSCLIVKFKNNSSFSRSEILGVWKIVLDLSRSLNQRNRPAGTAKVLLISALIQQLNWWLKNPSTHITLNRAERLRICVQGLIDIFFPWPSMTMNRLISFHQDISEVVHEMVDSVNAMLQDFEYVATSNGPVLDSSHQEGWLSLNRQLRSTPELELELA